MTSVELALNKKRNIESAFLPHTPTTPPKKKVKTTLAKCWAKCLHLSHHHRWQPCRHGQTQRIQNRNPNKRKHVGSSYIWNHVVKIIRSTICPPAGNLFIIVQVLEYWSIFGVLECWSILEHNERARLTTLKEPTYLAGNTSMTDQV